MRGLTRAQVCLVREKAGEGLSEVANGLGFHLVLAITSRARDSAEESGVAEGVEGIGQGLGLTGKEEEREADKGGRGKRKEMIGEGNKEGRGKIMGMLQE